MKQVTIQKLALSIMAITSIFIACKKQDMPLLVYEEPASSAKKTDGQGFAENDMVMYWNEKTATVLSVAMSQPARSRYFAMIQIAVHDALNSIKPRFECFALLNERNQFASPDAAVASAAYWTIKGLGRQANFPLDAWLTESLAIIPEGESKELGKILGKKAADAIIANRANDGFTQVIASAPTPADGINAGEYRSTLPYSNPALNLPHLKTVVNWGTVMRPFVIQSNNQFRPSGPYPVNTPEYANDYDESKTKGARVGSTRNESEETLSKFWSEIRSSIIWNNFTRKMIAGKKIDAWKTARLFALVHTVAADGTNAGLEAKYHFYNWRPETAIRSGDADGNPNTIGDPGWLPSATALANTNPLMNAYTPTVPEYPSSFAIFAGGAAGVIQSFFGTDEAAVDLESAGLPGTILHFSSIEQAATDNSFGVLYAGWYFRKAVVDVKEQGKRIAEYVFNNAFTENND